MKLRNRISFYKHFKASFRSVYKYVYYTASSANVRELEQLTSEIFKQAYKRFEAYDGSVTFDRWVINIAKEVLFPETVETTEEVETTSDSRVALREYLGSEMLGFTRVDRDIMKLYISGYSTIEIARAMEHSEVEVEKKLRRIMRCIPEDIALSRSVPTWNEAVAEKKWYHSLYPTMDVRGMPMA